MIEISGFPDKFWMFAKNPEHWSEPLVFYMFFPAGRAVTGKGNAHSPWFMPVKTCLL